MPMRKTLALALSSIACVTANVLPSVIPDVHARICPPGRGQGAHRAPQPRPAAPAFVCYMQRGGRGIGAGHVSVSRVQLSRERRAARALQTACWRCCLHGQGGGSSACDVGMRACILTVGLDGEQSNQRSVAAFAAAPALSLRAPVVASQSSFVNALT
jgi:hypothetical protein